MGQDDEQDREADLPLGKVLEFMRLLWAIDHALQSASKRMDAQLGVTGPQRLVLRIVGRFPGIAAGLIAETLKVHPSTLTGVFRRLEQRGLLTRRGDPRDARRALFELTTQGAEVDAIRKGTVEAAVRRALRRLSPVERAAAESALGLIIDELERDG